jgi:putative peptidoglycan lipid II flippase
MQNLRTAFLLYVLENALNVILAIILVGPLGIRGVALSISIAYTVAAVVALLVLRTQLGGLDWAVVSKPFGRVLLATVALVAAAAIGSNLSASQSPLGLAARVLTGFVFGGVAYVVVAFSVGALEQRNKQIRRARSAGPARPGSPPAPGRGRLDRDR